MKRAQPIPWLVRLGRLAAVAILAAPLCGCLTIGLVTEAKGDLGHQARVKGIRSAWTEEKDLVLQMSVDPTGPADPRDVRYRVPVESIGHYGMRQLGGAYQDGALKLDQAEVGCFQPPDQSIESDARLPIRTLRVRYEDLEPALRTLPVGVHVLALSFDRKTPAADAEWGEADAVAFDRKTTTALVAREPDGSARHTLIYGFSEQTKKQWALLLLMPLTVAGDVVTLPLQIIAVFSGGC
jgi:hypothetical protein